MKTTRVTVGIIALSASFLTFLVLFLFARTRAKERHQQYEQLQEDIYYDAKTVDEVCHALKKAPVPAIAVAFDNGVEFSLRSNSGEDPRPLGGIYSKFNLTMFLYPVSKKEKLYFSYGPHKLIESATPRSFYYIQCREADYGIESTDTLIDELGILPEDSEIKCFSVEELTDILRKKRLFAVEDTDMFDSDVTFRAVVQELEELANLDWMRATVFEKDSSFGEPKTFMLVNADNKCPVRTIPTTDGYGMVIFTFAGAVNENFGGTLYPLSRLSYEFPKRTFYSLTEVKDWAKKENRFLIATDNTVHDSWISFPIVCGKIPLENTESITVSGQPDFLDWYLLPTETKIEYLYYDNIDTTKSTAKISSQPGDINLISRIENKLVVGRK
ncbi:MAG: hypothetical protein CEN89_660 [Candidatus Berkelbacteria bacterium Licking1014_7]|uniref:Uncharacterized protein n=1 Tax=Candidatus Berkelbacteria bacterium Licking1014_7 TaxID=2017147 RepID=A0A554LHY8_9BACT|nr:MAG: hypothetical protein CEN89_660 [Candidatus Berkelbacteria bacterium Licking1014_7]